MDSSHISTKKRKRKHGTKDSTTDGAKDKKLRKKEKLERKKKKKVLDEDAGGVEEVQEADEEEGGGGEVEALSSERNKIRNKGDSDRDDKNDRGEEENNEADGDGTPKQPDADVNTGSNDIPLHSSLSLPMIGEHPVKFADLNLSDATRKAIAAMGFEKMTDVQSRTIPPLMAGRDVRATLSFNSFLTKI